MVKTGARAAALSSLLSMVDRGTVDVVVRAPRVRDLIPDLAATIGELFQSLGGDVDTVVQLRPGSWDLVLEDGLLLELDEELHFNRYRRRTLDVDWARALPWTRTYIRYCEEREHECLQAADWGKRWTSPSSERLFGPAGTAGEFEGGGAPRWKQRALYDAMKDAFALSQSDHRVARVSVHDSIDGLTLEQILRTQSAEHAGPVAELVASRAT